MEPLENRIHKLEEYVKPVLDTNVSARCDDFILILEVYKKFLGKTTYLEDMTFADLMENHIVLNLPPFESITRCRRKLQELYPELQADDKVALIRTNETATYIEYALDI